jgi:signal transduction histidine kinase
MNEFLKKLSVRYATKMHQYLACEEETHLQQAYELGRSAITSGLGIMDIARIHQETLIILMSRPVFQATYTQTLKAAEAFFFEALSPFEATQRGFKEANNRLQQLNGTLEERNVELARINAELEDEISERRRTEQALRESEENLRHLSQRVLHVQEEERKRISRELHDEVGQSLTAVNVDLAMLKKTRTPTPAQLEKKLTDAQRQVEQTMETVHRFARELRPAMLDDLGLLPALRSYAQNFSTRTGIKVEFRACPGVERLEGDAKTVVFRVAQESLTNVAKHAHATQVQLMVREHTGGIQLQIKDNGRAFEVSKKLNGKAKKRLGLLGMQERVRLVNGTFSIDSTPGSGTEVKVEIPFVEVGRPEKASPLGKHPTAGTAGKPHTEMRYRR